MSFEISIMSEGFEEIGLFGNFCAIEEISMLEFPQLLI